MIVLVHDKESLKNDIIEDVTAVILDGDYIVIHEYGYIVHHFQRNRTEVTARV